jgi:hypothetical protein
MLLTDATEMNHSMVNSSLKWRTGSTIMTLLQDNLILQMNMRINGPPKPDPVFFFKIVLDKYIP